MSDGPFLKREKSSKEHRVVTGNAVQNFHSTNFSIVTTLGAGINENWRGGGGGETCWDKR